MAKQVYKAVAIYLATLLFFLMPLNADAMDYEIDWPTSISGKQHTLRITIDGCITLINVKHSDLEKFSNSNESLNEVIALAIKRSKNGCK
jgi:hypothetical protein